MKIVIAPDSFKGSLTAKEVALAIGQGILAVFPECEIVQVPMADGGEGTVQSLVDSTGGEIVEIEVTGPLGTPVKAFFGLLGDGLTAVIEMASASGLPLVPGDRRNPLLTTTYGTGELIRAALDLGVTNLVIGIGGSATNDGGAGMAMALGARLLDSQGRDLGFGGGELSRLSGIDVSGWTPACHGSGQLWPAMWTIRSAARGEHQRSLGHRKVPRQRWCRSLTVTWTIIPGSSSETWVGKWPRY